MQAALKPVSRAAALRDQVYDSLRESLRAGKIRPGDRLGEISVAEALGVSRTPAREALALLAQDRLVQAEGRGFVVPSLSARDISDIFELRRLLEPAAVETVAAVADPLSIARLHAAVAASAAADRSGDLAAFIEANAAFRAAWLTLVPNRRLAEAVALYDDHVERLRILTLAQAAVRAVVIRGIGAIATALAGQDGPAAAAAMRDHLAQAQRAMRDAAVSRQGEP